MFISFCLLVIGASAQTHKGKAIPPQRVAGPNEIGWIPNQKYVKVVPTKPKMEFRCIGTNKDATQCKRHVTVQGAYCTQHQYQSPGRVIVPVVKPYVVPKG